MPCYSRLVNETGFLQLLAHVSKALQVKELVAAPSGFSYRGIWICQENLLCLPFYKVGHRAKRDGRR